MSSSIRLGGNLKITERIPYNPRAASPGPCLFFSFVQLQRQPTSLQVEPRPIERSPAPCPGNRQNQGAFMHLKSQERSEVAGG